MAFPVQPVLAQSHQRQHTAAHLMQLTADLNHQVAFPVSLEHGYPCVFCPDGLDNPFVCGLFHRSDCRAYYFMKSRSRSSSLRSEEHTSELQSRQYLVCRLLLEKK